MTTAAVLETRPEEQKAGSEPELIEPRVAAVELLSDFRGLARELVPFDPSTEDDLVQEMALAALLAKQPQTLREYRLAACWRAIDYLRWWYGPMLKRRDQVKKGWSVCPAPNLDDFCEDAPTV